MQQDSVYSIPVVNKFLYSDRKPGPLPPAFFVLLFSSIMAIMKTKKISIGTLEVDDEETFLGLPIDEMQEFANVPPESLLWVLHVRWLNFRDIQVTSMNMLWH